MEIKKTGLWFGRQAVRMCLMVLLVSILAFVLLAVSPIDPLQTNVGQTALGSMSPEQIAKCWKLASISIYEVLIS